MWSGPARRGLTAGARRGASVWCHAVDRDPEHQLLTDAAIDALAEQICVAAMARVFLDHVDQHRAERDRRPVPIVAE